MSRLPYRCVAAMCAAALLFATAEAWVGAETRPAPTPPKLPQQARLFTARQQIDAQVAKVDESRNTVTLRTEAGKLQLEAPPTVHAALKKGDRVVLELGILPSAHGGPPARGRPAREGTNPAVIRQQLDAEVAGADLKTGVLTLKSAAGTAQVELPSSVITAFKKGEVVRVELAVIPATNVEPSAATRPERARRAGLAAFLMAIFGKK
jgi:uncharacterized protein (UPF0218 family)